MKPEIPPYRRGGGFGSLGVRFEEVLEPEPVSLVPQTLGAWVTLGVLALAALAGIAWLVVRHVRRRYRREAENELRVLQKRWETEQRKGQVLEAVPAVLKRCALGSFERARVAPLSGEPWLRFLNETGKAPFGDAAGRALLAITTRGASALPESDARSLFLAASLWIRRHRADV